MALDVEIVTPRGVALERGGLSRIVLRRREEGFELGSEVAILPRHGEMMVHVPECDIALVDEDGPTLVHIADGFAEVRDDHVIILTSAAAVVPSAPPECPRA